MVGYPWISDWCYRVHTQSSVAVYAAEAKEQSDVKAQLMQDAIAYNTWLSEAHITLSDPFSGAQIVEKPELPYTSQLALDDSGILAFIEIPKIHVYLPVYHTTSAEVLQWGAGHMEGTALPVGGAGNRPVISAHSGMNRAQMFSDLSDLETGDLFLIHVLDETLTYQVCDMAVILPEDTQALASEKDRDLVSLVTCTPWKERITVPLLPARPMASIRIGWWSPESGSMRRQADRRQRTRLVLPGGMLTLMPCYLVSV